MNSYTDMIVDLLYSVIKKCDRRQTTIHQQRAFLDQEEQRLFIVRALARSALDRTLRPFPEEKHHG